MTEILHTDTRVRVDLHDGTDVLANPDWWVRLYQDVYTADLHLPDHRDPPLRERLLRNAARSGFTAAVAYVDDHPAGYLYGYPLPAETGWWDGLRPQPEPELVREWPGRTLAICELLIRSDCRQRHLGLRLYEAFLANRREERAAALVAHTNARVLALADSHGWTRLGDLEPYPGWRPHAAFVLPLRTAAAIPETAR